MASYHQDLKKLVELARQETNSELEVRFHVPEAVYKDRSTFERVLAAFQGIKKNDKYLDVINPTSDGKFRVRLTGNKTLEAFKNKAPLDALVKDTKLDALSIKKTILKRVKIPDYNMSVVLSREDETSPDRILKEDSKIYRYKQRYSLFQEPFRYDFTAVRTDVGQVHYEYEIEIFVSSDTLQDEHLVDMVLEKTRRLMSIILNQEDMLSNSVQQEVLSEYMSLLGKRYQAPMFVGPQPTTFEHQHLKETSDGYSATLKLDGERRLLFFDRKGFSYLINQKLQVEKAYDEAYLAAARSLFDVEKVKGAKLMVFDTYFFANKPYHQDFLSTRLLVAQRLAEIADSFVEVKTFVNADQSGIEHLANKMKISHDALPNDGIIFTPWEDPLPLKLGPSKKWDRLLKWKPPSHNSVDFRLEYSDTMTRDFQNYKRYKLQCMSVTNDFSSMMSYINNPKVTYELVDFEPVNPHMALPPDNLSMVWVEEDKPSLHGKIIECTFRDDGWLAVRERTDKVSPNDLNVAASTWKMIINPVSLEDLAQPNKDATAAATAAATGPEDDVYYLRQGNSGFRGDLIVPLKTFHNNFVKGNALINKFKGKVLSVFDPACGQGGDLRRYQDIGARDMLGVDVVAHNLYNKEQGAIRRLSQAKNLPEDARYVFLNMDSSKPLKGQIDDQPDKELKNILWGVGDKRVLSQPLEKYYKMAKPHSFDLVSCQFALHYFFKNKDSLTNFVDNVDYMLAPGGYFIGTCFDANKIDAMFSRETVHQGYKNEIPIWKIAKKYKGVFNNARSVGYKLSVYIASIGQEMDEYMVSFDLLASYLAARGIRPLTSEEEQQMGLKTQLGFEQIYNDTVKSPAKNVWIDHVRNMSPAEKELSFLYKYFVFTRNV